jgi:diguanylate cyclase (GGDEF)-like protein
MKQIYHDWLMRHRPRASMPSSASIDYQTVYRQLPVSIILYDLDGMLLDGSNMMERVFNISRDAVVGKYNVLHNPENIELGVPAYFARAVNGETVRLPPVFYSKQYVEGRRDDEPLWLEVTFSPVRSASGAVVGVAAMEVHFSLTDLPNRTLLVEFMQHIIGRYKHRSDEPFAVICLDIDNFRRVSECLGHETGILLLRMLAKRVQEHARPGDIVACSEDDEFMVVLQAPVSLDEASHICYRLLQCLAAPISIAGHTLRLSANAGIVLADHTAREPGEYLRDAKIAMRRARQQGRGRYVFFDHDMHRQATDLFQMETALYRALNHAELRLWYQPIVQLDTDAIVGFEALLRWQHPQRGLLTPAQFLSVAEENGLLSSISAWVLRCACRQLAQWQHQLNTRRLTVSVNISGCHLADPTFPAFLDRLIAEYAIDASSLHLELTEHTLLANTAQTRSNVQQIRATGVRLYIDDFGVGFSSLAYLHQFPIDGLKIDRSFINELRQHSYQTAVIQSILLLAEPLDCVVIAEGVETHAQAATLLQFGCKYAQGFLYSKAVPAEQAEALLLQELLQ